MHSTVLMLGLCYQCAVNRASTSQLKRSTSLFKEKQAAVQRTQWSKDR